MIKNLLWYKTCPFCNQGRLFIFKNLHINKLYLHCEECERGYYDPTKLKVENFFLSLQEEFNAIAATLEDIKEHDWDNLHFNIVNE